MKHGHIDEQIVPASVKEEIPAHWRNMTMAAQRIDFKFVKAQADFLLVLRHYHIEVYGSGVSRTIRCPFHQEKKASCKVNLGRKIFHCFGCDAKGNILEFVRR